MVKDMETQTTERLDLWLRCYECGEKKMAVAMVEVEVYPEIGHHPAKSEVCRDCFRKGGYPEIKSVLAGATE
jgi:hypothetical protein